jgi:hypothetical protein
MSYIINNSRGQIVAVVGDGTVNTTATDLALVGRAVTNYGEYQNENYVYLLENFAGPSAPIQPILGQLWYNSQTDAISAYNTANAWVALATQDYVQLQKISPAFTGTPTAPTAAAGTSTTQLATTAFVTSNPQFSGVPTAPTATSSTNTTQLATTAFVQNRLSSTSGISSAGTIIATNFSTAGLINATGNVTGGNFLTAGLINATGNVTGGNLSTAGLINATGNVTGGNLTTAGEISAAGNVIGANFIGNVIPPAGGAVSTTGNITGGNILTSGQISAGGNFSSGGVASVTGNITGGNISTGGIVSATGNIITTNTIIADIVIANTVITTGTTSAFRLPNLTQTQINALSSQNGDMVYNTTDDLPQIYQAGSWKNFTISYYS